MVFSPLTCVLFYYNFTVTNQLVLYSPCLYKAIKCRWHAIATNDKYCYPPVCFSQHIEVFTGYWLAQVLPSGTVATCRRPELSVVFYNKTLWYSSQGVLFFLAFLLHTYTVGRNTRQATLPKLPIKAILKEYYLSF